MSYHSGVSYHPSIVTPGGMPMAGMPVAGMPVGTPYATPYGGNALMMGGMGSEYGSPLVDSYPPMITRTPSLYEGRRSVYEDDLYDRDYRYGRDYYDRDYEGGRRYYDDDDYYLRRSSSRASRRSSRRDYDDYYDRDYDRYDDRYYDNYRNSRYHPSRSYSSGYYPSSSSHYYSSSRSRSGRKREDMSIVTKRDGGVKVLRNGEERIGDRVRRMFGIDPKGVNVVRLKRGESLAANIRR